MRRCAALLLVVAVLSACGGQAPEPSTPASSTSAPDAPAVPAATAAPTASEPPAQTVTPPAASATPAVPTGGSVLLGEIAAAKAFDPRPAIESFKPQLLGCYNQVRASTPALHGKLDLRVLVNEGGSVVNVGARPGGAANDAALVSCIADAMKTLTFPKPGGSATVVVPLVFRP